MPAPRKKRRLAALCLAVAALVAASPALAQPEAYKPHMENGVKLFNDRNYPAAIAEFKAAYDAKPNPNPLVNIALCQKAMFAYPRAIAALETAIEKHGAAMTPADRQAAEDAIKEMRALLGVVVLKVVPPTASLLLDGEELPAGDGPRTLKLGPGTHKIEARAEGYAGGEVRVNVTSGQTQEALLELVAEKGFVNVTTPDPRMTITLDGSAVGTGTWSGPLPPGPHLVKMSGPGGPPYEAQFVVVAGKALEVRAGSGTPVPPKKEERTIRRGLYLLGTGSILFSPIHPPAWKNPTTDFGGAYGLRVGFQVNDVAGFDLSYQHSSISTGVIDQRDDSGEIGYRILADRVAASLRLISPGKTWRFVGSLGGGFVVDGVKFGRRAREACDPPSGSICPFKNSNDQKDAITALGIDAFALVEAGVELDVDHVLINLGFEAQFQSTGNLNTTVQLEDKSSVVVGIYGARPIVNIGPALRVGYRFW